MQRSSLNLVMVRQQLKDLQGFCQSSRRTFVQLLRPHEGHKRRNMCQSMLVSWELQ